MDNEDFKTVPQPDAPNEVANLKAQYEALHQVVITMLILLIVVSGTVWIYLLRQVRYTRTELEGLRAQATNMVAQYDQRTGPAMDDFLKKLAEYGKTHPDFAPVLAKYGLAQSNLATAAGAPKASPSTTAPMTAPKTTPKK